MSREGYGLLRFVSSDDGTRCAAECPHVVRAVGQGDCDECAAFTDILSFNNGANVRLPACIAAEQAAASVPSCRICETAGPEFCSACPPSVPSCEGAAWAIGDRVRHAAGWIGEVTYLHPNGDMVEAQPYNLASKSFYPLWALTRLPPDDHLDGGARALDASETRAWTRGDRVRSSFSGRTGTLLDPPDSDGEAFVKWDDRHVHAGGGVYAPASDLTRIPSESEALREARVQGMREGADITIARLLGTIGDRVRAYANEPLDAAIEAVRKGER